MEQASRGGERRIGVDIEHAETLVAYLRACGHIGPNETPSCRRLDGGVSNRTVLVEREDGDAWVLKQSLGMLRVSVEWYSDPERIHREALGMKWLERLLPKGSVPKLIFEDRDLNILAMQAIAPPNPTWKELLLRGELERRHVVGFAELLATLHRTSHEESRTLRPVFGDQRFFETLRIEPFYQYTGARVDSSADFMRNLVSDARNYRLALVHGDYSPKNVLVHNGRMVLLDHETIHYGDPAFDIGFSITHLLSKGHFLQDMREAFADAARLYWEVYRENIDGAPWIEGLEQRAVRHTLGCLAARAAGRSPLEYLDEASRRKQIEAVCTLMSNVPGGMHELTDRFMEEIK